MYPAACGGVEAAQERSLPDGRSSLRIDAGRTQVDRLLSRQLLVATNGLRCPPGARRRCQVSQSVGARGSGT